ncbi:MAG TPA: 2Fe-2S iron-sulfur cluster-binding protein [Longimicrobiales bacterium]|nr:2Fe-2S iron-sulfur cluster-binding protein [Longimicrobiales bacterium]
MNELIEIHVNGRAVRIPEEASLAAALLAAGESAFRRSVTGAPRGPVCGMGVCYECRVTVNGVPHVRACLEPVMPGMEVVTGE